MGFVESLPLIQKHTDDEIQRWAYVPETDMLLFWPWTESTHSAKLYENGVDRHNTHWFGGYAVPSTGELSMSYGNHNMADWVEQRVRAEFPKTSSWKVSDDVAVTDTPAPTTPTPDEYAGTTLKILPDKHLVRLYNISYGWMNSSHPHKRKLHRLVHDEIHRRIQRDKENRISSIDDGSCPICQQMLDTDAGGYSFCSNCGWFPAEDTIPGEEQDPEEYLHERDFPDYHNDPGWAPAWLSNTTSKVEVLPDEFKPHAHDEESRRTFMYLPTSDTLYIAPNNAYHNDMEYWLHQNRPEEWGAMFDEHGFRWDEHARGFFERDTDDNTLTAQMYAHEGMPRLPEHIQEELHNHFGEPVYHETWDPPRAPDPFDRYDPEPEYYEDPTEQYPTGWSKDEGIIASMLKTAADVRELAARAYDQIMARPDVQKIYDQASKWENEYQSERAEGEPAKNLGQMMKANVANNIEDEEKRRQTFAVLRAHNSHLLADQIQWALTRILNTHPAAYKLMPNAVKTLKTWASEAENENGEGKDVQWNRNPGQHVGDIYGQAGELLQRLRAQNRVPQGMDVNRMSFSDLQDWLYSFRENEDDESGYRTNNIVYDLGNGWHIVRITDDEDLRTEGELMGHCVGGYCERVYIGTSLIYSLRDPKNMPHATIEISGQHHSPPLSPANSPYNEDQGTVPPDDWQVVQIQGKSNSEPIPEYQQMIRQWFTYLQDDEGVKFEPMESYDLIEYVQDEEELMGWYYEHGNDPAPDESDPHRDKYGLPLSADGNNENGLQFEWTTILDYCVDSLMPKDSILRSYRHDYSTYTPDELTTAYAAALKRYAPNLSPKELGSLVDYAERELTEKGDKLDEAYDGYTDAMHLWQQDNPEQEADWEHPGVQQYAEEYRSEVHSEALGEASQFVQLLAQKLVGHGAFGAQSKTKVIYV